ncbi:hypothetical protein [Actinokineospora inagensis]|uniref:hypothetical protein n=1 Tax=Actinokineospora inagensis TaxID=103730 RepID=UPI0003FC8750|nr:hypothetical protein [Actinokineospora inagensis]
MRSSRPPSDLLRKVAHPPFISDLAEAVRGREGAVLTRLYDMLATAFVTIGSASRQAYDEDDFV